MIWLQEANAATANVTEPGFVSGLLAGTVLILLGQIVWRLTHRRAALTWWADWSPTAVSSEGQFGTIEVRYDGHIVRTVYYCALKVRNDSPKDLENVRFILGFADGSRFAISAAQVEGSLIQLPMTPSFFDSWRTASERNDQAAMETHWRHRDYTVPALNRGATVVFGATVLRDSAQTPTIQLSCETAGTRLRAADRRMLFIPYEVRTAGLAIFALGLLAIVVAHAVWRIPVALLTLGFVVGTATGALGNIVLRFWRWLARIF